MISTTFTDVLGEGPLAFAPNLGVSPDFAPLIAPFLGDGLTISFPATLYMIHPSHIPTLYDALQKEAEDFYTPLKFSSLFEKADYLTTLPMYGPYPLMYFRGNDSLKRLNNVFNVIREFEEVFLPNLRRNFSSSKEVQEALDICKFVHVIQSGVLRLDFAPFDEKRYAVNWWGCPLYFEWKAFITSRDIDPVPPKVILNREAFETLKNVPKDLFQQIQLKDDEGSEPFPAYALQSFDHRMLQSILEEE